ncbi:MAG: hypothetical protein NT006_04935 [Candidatus Aminicenantes bacterium]|nr:hypothetical protein [Candidatus Aminicenantes bacterium]
MPEKDDWDARYIPETKRSRRRGGNRSQGLLLILVAIGIPLVAFFFQVDGALRFYETDKVFERTLTQAEKQEIQAAVNNHKAKLDKIQRVIEEVKEKYRGETGESYDRDVWVVHVKEGLAIPFKYLLAFGAILFLIGIGKLII